MSKHLESNWRTTYGALPTKGLDTADFAYLIPIYWALEVTLNDPWPKLCETQVNTG